MPVARPSASIVEHFADLSDPRRGKVVHPLINIVSIALCATICGADDFVSMAEFGLAKKEWFAKFLDLSAGVPSHDRFNAVFAALKPAEFEKCLLSWLAALQEVAGGKLVAIDGKTLRRSFDAASGKSAIHMVSAWCNTNQVSLGQVVTDQKSNEITAIPALLDLLELHGALITIDAMGCQTKIAERIIEGGADYALAAKSNQPTLYDGIDAFFTSHMENDFAEAEVDRCETNEKGHGRREHRSYFVCAAPADLPDRVRWKGLKAVGAAVSETVRDGKTACQVRYYILSRRLSAKEFAAAVRGHWGIENNLHWQLDVSFGEDQCRVRKNHGDANLSVLRRASLSLLKNNKTKKLGVKNKRLFAGWCDDYLAQLLFGM